MARRGSDPLTDTKYIHQKWFVAGPPWFDSRMVGLMILAGSEDGNVGQVISDQSFLASIDPENNCPSDDELRATTRHIVEIHNQWLEEQERQSLMSKRCLYCGGSGYCYAQGYQHEPSPCSICSGSGFDEYAQSGQTNPPTEGDCGGGV